MALTLTKRGLSKLSSTEWGHLPLEQLIREVTVEDEATDQVVFSLGYYGINCS